MEPTFQQSEHSEQQPFHVEQSRSDQISAGHLGPGEQEAQRLQVDTEPHLTSSGSDDPCQMMIPQSGVPSVSPSTCGSGMKRKRLHLDSLDCSDLAQSAEGSLALKNPSMIRTSSLDSNRGLYPRHSTRRPIHHSPSSPHHWPKASSSSDPASPQVTSSSPKRNLNTQFTSSPTRSHKSPSTCGSKIFPSSAALNDSRSCSTPTRMFPKPCQSPSPKKSAKGTTGSDINNYNSLDKFPSEVPLTPPRNNFIQASHSSTPTKLFPNPRQSPRQSPSLSEPAKSTTDSDIEDFYKDNSLDGFDVEEALSLSGSQPEPCSSSKAGKTTVDHDIETFDNNTFFDNIDPNLLDAEPIPLHQVVSSSPNTYGLLGEGHPTGSSFTDEEASSSVGFQDLPPEVLERIFCFVPMMDVCLHIAPVCKHWHEIISKEDFMPWKKTYHRMRVKSRTDVAEQMNAITHDRIETEDTCLLDLVRNMPKFKARYSHAMDRDLQKHHQYVLAKDLMKSKAPDVLQNEEPNPWSTIALLVILSETVQDVSLILECLLHRTASCTTMEVLECLYCTAAYLWKYKDRFKLNSGFHYRVYHALHLFENSHTSVAVATEEPSAEHGMVGHHPLPLRRHRLPPTHEQCRIINHDVARGTVLKIVAFAGTGKTTTLVKYTERRPDTSFLYVAFNKSVMQHAIQIFPSNVSSRTTHSLAYEAIGYKYKKKLQGSFDSYHVHKALPPGNRKELQWRRYANLVCKTFGQFCASADEHITTQHVPTHYCVNVGDNGSLVAVVQKQALDHGVRMKISNDASYVWKKMTNVNDMDAPRITHDVYLKLYQLSKPQNLVYDCLLIDEAQDLTPAQQDILLNQKCAKIMVGDPFQQIYSFRGATNAMSRIPSGKTFHLTQSFRFGTEIAYVANCLLEKANGNNTSEKQMLIGKREPGHIDGVVTGQLAIITRCNVTLFKEAVKIVLADETTTLGFAGGIERYGMDVILDIYQLMQPESSRGQIRNRYIQKHKSFQALKMHSNDTENFELLNKIKIVNTFNIRIPELVEKIQNRSRPQSMADIVLSTAHQAKGLEFDTVKITDDFAICAARTSPLCVLPRDEMNMVYVAVTRARKSLVLNSSLMEFISGSPPFENFAYPFPAGSATGEGDKADPPCCIKCQQTIPKDSVVLLRTKEFKLAYPTKHKQSGILCPLCSVEMYPYYRCLFTEELLQSSQG